ncbi:putative bifunctional diguanylate cyclase/phosphodiesterase [Methylobacterium segetis]|uniref:putative bifunctional diguanylate cyclase/phosphodiesterase n=1 Tax=Methylobacterium segetis TaxID=2488750 RepID=UPI00104BB15E|nr:EAL domain-containing protein [Methylobacterium segetis]
MGGRATVMGRIRAAAAPRGRGAPGGPQGRYRLDVQGALINETLQVANYSAAAHIVAVLAVAAMLWSAVSHTYLICLVGAIVLLVGATFGSTMAFRNTFRRDVSEAKVRCAYRVSQALAVGIGSAWGSMPAYLMGHPDSSTRYIAIATTAGLISDAYGVGPIFSVSLALVLPIVAGAYIGLFGFEPPTGAYLSVMLTVYAAFVIAITWRTSLLSYQRLLDRVVVQDQSQTIGLLLNEFEEGASDWLWETDAQGRLRHVPARMAAALSRPLATLPGLPLEDLLASHVIPGPGAGAAEELRAAIARQVPFQSVTLHLRTDEGPRHWTINGKPFLDRDGLFAGYRIVGSDTTRSREAEARIGYLATHDPLTGLANRAAFQEALTAACGAGAEPHALLYLDLDGFKAVNDSAGHSTGDRLLEEVAGRLTGLAAGRARVYRLGGDEFALLLPDADADAPLRLAARIVAEIGRPYRIDARHVEIGVSVGIAWTSPDAQDPAKLLHRADLALYSAKNGGRGCWRAFEPALEARMERRRRLDVEMRRALQDGELELHYQPLVNLENGRVAGFEALLRWFRADEGFVAPGEIIPIAESTGFIVEIGQWALRRACSDAIGWDGLRVAVNISPLHVRMPGFHADVAAALADTGLAPHRLEIEITESILLDQETVVLENLARLRDLGVRVALDDFGTGYSSLSYLTLFAFDKIKIDRSVVRDLDTRPERTALVEAMTGMARAFSMDVTVEGVETEEQCEILRRKRCDTAQGFLYSGARPAREIPALIRSLEARIAGDGAPSIQAA